MSHLARREVPSAGSGKDRSDEPHRTRGRGAESAPRVTTESTRTRVILEGIVTTLSPEGA